MINDIATTRGYKEIVEFVDGLPLVTTGRGFYQLVNDRNREYRNWNIDGQLNLISDPNVLLQHCYFDNMASLIPKLVKRGARITDDLIEKALTLGYGIQCEALKALLENGGNACGVDSLGRSFIHYAISRGHDAGLDEENPAVKILMQYDAKLVPGQYTTAKQSRFYYDWMMMKGTLVGCAVLGLMGLGVYKGVSGLKNLLSKPS